MSELKKPVQEVVDNLKGKLSVENGVIKAADDTVDAVLKPFLEAHNLTEKQITAVQDHISAVAAGYAYAAADVVSEAMKKDKKLETVSGEIKVGRSTISTSFARERQYRNPQDASKPIVKHLVLEELSIDTKQVMSKDSVKKQIAHFADRLSD